MGTRSSMQYTYIQMIEGPMMKVKLDKLVVDPCKSY